MVRILVIDDDSKICLFFSKFIEQMGYEFNIASTLKEARSVFYDQNFDLVLLDLELPDGNGLDILQELIDSRQSPEVIIITGTGDARGAELAFKYGAWDYIQKPFLLDEVTLPITRALQYREEKLSKPHLYPLVRNGIIGESKAICKSLEEVGRAAASDASVLITGETGTGKELFAQAIHENSKRMSGPFIPIDCGALPENLIESTLFGFEKGAFTGAEKKQAGLLSQANGGTLMLDEVGDLPLVSQKSFLRTLQERSVRPVGGTKEIPVDIRIVAATNLDLDKMVEKGLFRKDLLYRIRAMEIKLPPLRDREKDVEEIAFRKLHELSARYNIETKVISSEFSNILSSQNWPGNVRELINVLEHSIASAGNDPTLFPKHMPPKYRATNLKFKPKAPLFSDNNMGLENPEKLPTLTDYRDNAEKEYLKKLILAAKGNRKDACSISKISQSRLYALLEKHSLPKFGTA